MKTFQKKKFVIAALLILIFIPLVLSQAPAPYKYDDSGNVITGGDSPTTPSTPPADSADYDKNPLEWIKQNANDGIEFKDATDKDGKVTGTSAVFKNPEGELKIKKPDGSGEYTIGNIVSEKEGKKARVELNADGTIKDVQLTAKSDAEKPVELYIENTKVKIPGGASFDYSKDTKKSNLILRGNELDEMPQQIDKTKQDGIEVRIKAEEPTKLPNGVILKKGEPGFPASTITSRDGKDYVIVGDAPKLNGATLYNPTYSETNFNQDTEILGLRETASKSDLGSEKTIDNNYVKINPKEGILETGSAKGKVGAVISMDKENAFMPGLEDESFFAVQARDGGVVQILNKGDNKPAEVNTQGKFIISNGPKHNFYQDDNGKIQFNPDQPIPGINLGSEDKYSAPFIMKNYDEKGNEIIKGHMVVMNSNNGYAVVPIGTEQSQLSNGDVWRSSLSSRVTPPGGAQETPVIDMPNTPSNPSSELPPGTPVIDMPSVPSYTPPDPTAQPLQPKGKVSDMIMKSSVRIKVQDPDGNSVGSGTIIGEDGKGNVIIATAGHLFKDFKGGSITIDTFTPQQTGSMQGVVAKSRIPARLIGSDYDKNIRDVALISVPKNQLGNFQSAKVMPSGYRIAPGKAAFTAGCANGADCTLWEESIVGLDKFIGGPNVESSKQSIEGRSGGGLFTAEGIFAGVINAADPTDKQTIHSDVSLIRQLLDKQGLSHVYRLVFALVQFN